MYPVPPAVVVEVVRLLPRGASSVVCFYTIVFSSELTLDDDRRKAQPRHVQPTSTEILGIENVIICMMMLQLYYVPLYVFLREIGGKNQFEMLLTYISMEVLIRGHPDRISNKD